MFYQQKGPLFTPLHYSYSITNVTYVWLSFHQDTTKADDVVAFIKSHDVPLVGHMTMDLEEKRYHSERRPLVLFFYTVDWSHEHRSGAC